MDPKKSGGQVENSFQAEKDRFWDFVFYQKITFGPIWGRDPKRGPKWTRMVPKGPPLGPKGPPWAQRAHLEAEGRLKGPLGPIGDPSCYPHGGVIGIQRIR